MAAEDVVIVPYRDGPYLVRGPMVLRDQDGQEIELSRRTVALCRCGKSRMRPFCDGTHRLVSFRAPSAREDPWSDGPAGAPPAERLPAERPPAERSAVERPAAERSINGRAAVTPALSPLRRASALAAQLDDRMAPSCAIHEARALVDGALRLVEATPPGAPQPYPAAGYLVEGALAALAPLSGREPTVGPLESELAVVAQALGSSSPSSEGSWPS